MTLPEKLAALPDPALASAIQAFADAVAEISGKLRTAETGKAGTTNDFGEEQLAVDVLADRIIFDRLQASGVVATGASEETAAEVALGGSGFAAAWDPLDGSSLVDVDLAVGTIFGIWPDERLVGRKGFELAAAGYAVYGPRTVLVIGTDRDTPPSEWQLNSSGEWIETVAELRIGEGLQFAPGNLRATADNPGYAKLVDYWRGHGYQLRYSGGMVPDIHQILRKGKGVFSFPGSAAAPAKLRLAFECAPLAWLATAAGGGSSDGQISILHLAIESLDQRTPVCIGSKQEVRRFEELVGG